MKKQEKEYYIETLQVILYSGKLSKKNTAKLATLIEKIKNTNTKSGLDKILKLLWDFLT
jgi:hypothetical protein